MTVFNEQKDKDQGIWFSYQASHLDKEKGKYVFDKPLPDAAEFCIRSLVPFYLERLKNRKKMFQFVLNTKTNQMERIGYYEEQSADEIKKEEEDAWDYGITGIKNAHWQNEKADMDCTRENKIRLMKNEDKSFDRFLSKCLNALSEIEAKSEKN